MKYFFVDSFNLIVHAKNRIKMPRQNRKTANKNKANKTAKNLVKTEEIMTPKDDFITQDIQDADDYFREIMTIKDDWHFSQTIQDIQDADDYFKEIMTLKDDWYQDIQDSDNYFREIMDTKHDWYYHYL